MKIIELIAKVKAVDPSLLENKSQEKTAAKLLRNALGVICQEIEKTESGIVRIGGFGNFQVKNIERTNKEGQAETRRIVTFSVQEKKVKTE